MRGSDKRSRQLFSYVDLEQRVRQDHPLRAIWSPTDAVLEVLSADFAALYSGVGRPSIPPEMLLRAMEVRYGSRDGSPARSSHGRGQTTIPTPADAAGEHSVQRAASSDISSSTTAMIQASSPRASDFFTAC